MVPVAPEIVIEVEVENIEKVYDPALINKIEC